MRNLASHLSLGLAVFIIGSAAAQDEKPKTHKVEAGPFSVKVTVDGVFEAEAMTEVVLRPHEWSSFVVEKAVDQGTEVAKGDPIIWFETEKIDDQLTTTRFAVDSGKLSLAAAELELAGLEESVPLDLRAARRSFDEAQRELEYYESVGEKMELRSAEESLKSSEYSLEYAQEELNQLEQMYKADDLTEETEEIILKRARRDVARSEFFLENAKIRHDRQVNESLPRQKEQIQDAAERAEIALEKAEATLPRSLEQKRIEVEKLRHTQRELEDNLKKLEEDRELMVVEAPAAGIVYYGQCERGKWTTAAVIDKQLRQGGTLSANQIVMTIVGRGPAFVRADVDESDLRHVVAQPEGYVIATAFPDTRMSAKVASVESIPLTGGKFDTRIVFEKELGQGPPLFAGMTCKATLTAYTKDDALTVPSSAVFSEETDDTQKYVYVAKEGEDPEKRSVKVGHVSGDKTEIIDGLAAGDEILLKKPE